MSALPDGVSFSDHDRQQEHCACAHCALLDAGVTIQAPQLDINTVAAGGGSRLFFRRGVFEVGPESAGAHPGPVCYRCCSDSNHLSGVS